MTTPGSVPGVIVGRLVWLALTPSGCVSFARPKSRIFDAAVVGDEDVLGLQVPVDDPLLVGGREALRNLQGVPDGPARREGPAGELRPQRLALEQFRDDVRCALVSPDVVDRKDVRVVECAGRLGLLLEALETLGTLGVDRRQDLDGDLALQSRVPRPVYLSHPAGAERRQDLVGPEASPGGKRHRTWQKLYTVVAGAKALETSGSSGRI